MQSKEIKIGETYAVVKWGSAQNVFPGNKFVEKATVLSRDPAGIKVRWADGGKGTVAPGKVKFTWTKHEAALAAFAENKANSLAAGQAADARIRELLGVTSETTTYGSGHEHTSYSFVGTDGHANYIDEGTKVYDDGSMSSGRYGFESSLSFAEVLELAYAKGRADAVQALTGQANVILDSPKGA